MHNRSVPVWWVLDYYIYDFIVSCRRVRQKGDWLCVSANFASFLLSCALMHHRDLKFNDRITQLIMRSLSFSSFPFLRRRFRAKMKVKKRIYLHLFLVSFFGKERKKVREKRHIKIHKMCLWLFSLKGITFHCL